MPDTGLAPGPGGAISTRAKGAITTRADGGITTRADGAMTTRADGAMQALLRENEKLRKINHALMAAAERGPDVNGGAFALFQTAAALGNQVQERTAALTEALAALTGAKEKEAQAKQLLAAAIEAINQGIVLCDSEDRIVVSNGRYRELWRGLPAEPGTKFADVVRGAARRGFVAAEGNPAAWERTRLERHRNPGGNFVIHFQDGTWLQVSERRVPGGGIVSLYTDITDIKRDEAQRRERELAEKSSLLQATLDNLSKGVSVFDAERQLVACNPAFLDFLSPGPRPAAAAALSAWCAERLAAMGLAFVQNGPETAGRRFQELRTSDGRTIEIRCSAMPAAIVSRPSWM